MSSSLGDSVRISIFGENHGEAIGVVLDNLPADCSVDEKQLALQMTCRASGRSLASTPYSEGDRVRIVSGLLNGKATGAPLRGTVRNTNAHSSDYGGLRVLPRPGHTDYTRVVYYNEADDVCGGGHFLGQPTAPLISADMVYHQILFAREICTGAYALHIASVTDITFGPVEVPDALLERLLIEYFSPIDRSVEAAMRQEIEVAHKFTDSAGGAMEYAVTEIPVSVGSSMLYGVENMLPSIPFGVPAVKDVGFGDGFAAASLHGSENSDAFIAGNGQVKTCTDHCGGILDGITAGVSLALRVAFRSTSSIGQEQNTVNLNIL